MHLRIGFMPDLRGASGGPAVFQRRLAAALKGWSILVTYDVTGWNVDKILLINATRHIPVLMRAKRRGTKIIQRLGLPFPSNRNLKINLPERIYTFLGMRAIALIRRYVADRIVYQSAFVKNCWEKEYGLIGQTDEIIYNGVDLDLFSPQGPRYESSADIRIISVEGTQVYPGKSTAFLVAKEMRDRGYDVELLVFGKPWADAGNRYSRYPFVRFYDTIPNEHLPPYYRGATLYVLNDIVAGCPNSVIEALACGVPVVGFKPGVLEEMLTEEAGRCVALDRDVFKDPSPGNIESLTDAALAIAENNVEFRQGARRLAEDRYGVAHMAERYRRILME